MSEYKNHATGIAALYAKNNYLLYLYAQYIDRQDLSFAGKVSQFSSIPFRTVVLILLVNTSLTYYELKQKAYDNDMDLNDMNVLSWLSAQFRRYDHNNCHIVDVDMAQVYEEMLHDD